MKHLPTSCQWSVRKFAITTGKDIITTFSTRMKRCLGKCIRYKNQSGVYYEIRLNLNGLKTINPDLVEDVVLHECAHTLAKGHGRRFQNYCIKLDIDPKCRGAKHKKEV